MSSVLATSVPDAAPETDIISNAELAALFRTAKDVYGLIRALEAAQPLHQQRHPRIRPRPIAVRVLNYYAYKKSERYHKFQVAKKQPGEFREVKAPEPGLKYIQRLLLLCLSACFPTFDKAAHGFVPGCSVLTNAKPHVGRRLVLNVDIRQFFPSTKVGRVARVLQLKPIGLSEKAAYLVANLCCDQGSLPQGAPTSPFLANLVCQRLDRRLRQLAYRHHCIYTRYADDLTFSSNRSVFKETFYLQLNSEVQEAGYELNEKKQRLQTRTMRQEVTGVVVNEKPNVSRKYRRQLRTILHNWANDKERAVERFRELYRASGNTQEKLARVVAGKIAYLGMIRGREDELYQSLATKLALLDNDEYRELSELVSILAKMQQLSSTIQGDESTE